VRGPLDGVKIIELAGIGPGPYACMLLADMGANILRLERYERDGGSESRSDPLNRSRHSIVVDLKHLAGRNFVLDLCENADVLIEGFRPGVTERLGLGPLDVWRRNPRLVYGRITGYGQSGPLSQRAGHDINYISVSGALWPIGRYGEIPVPPLNLIGDFGGGGLFLAMGVLAALHYSRESGEGQIVDAAMVDGSASMMAMTHGFLNNGTWVEERGVNLLDTGAHFYEVYSTKDEKFIAVGAIEPKFYLELLRGLNLEDEELPDQFNSSQWATMKVRFQRIFETKTRDEWTSIFEGRDACVTPVLSPREAVTYPHNVARNVFLTEGAIQPSPAPRFSLTPGSVYQMSTTDEANQFELLEKWGVNKNRLKEFLQSGAIGVPNSQNDRSRTCSQ
jgi:alpha-methylacyl-CoA racemase